MECIFLKAEKEIVVLHINKPRKVIVDKLKILSTKPALVRFRILLCNINVLRRKWCEKDLMISQDHHCVGARRHVSIFSTSVLLI